jgi:hypothetical protein
MIKKLKIRNFCHLKSLCLFYLCTFFVFLMFVVSDFFHSCFKKLSHLNLSFHLSRTPFKVPFILVYISVAFEGNMYFC